MEKKTSKRKALGIVAATTVAITSVVASAVIGYAGGKLAHKIVNATSSERKHIEIN